MAQRRGFSTHIVGDDNFLRLPIKSQVLYFHIGIRARNKGIVNNLFTIARCLGCTNSDIDALIESGYILPLSDSKFGSEWEIVHWYENNGIGETSKKRNNYKYRKWRQLVINRDKKCIVCESEKNLQAHHIKKFSQFPLLRFDVNNGIAMCESCHRKLHREERKNGRC